MTRPRLPWTEQAQGRAGPIRVDLDQAGHTAPLACALNSIRYDSDTQSGYEPTIPNNGARFTRNETLVSPNQTTLYARVSAAILEAAAAVLAERGEQASMADVAGAAGMARATVYRYFPNREALLEALGRLAIENAGEGLQAGRLQEVAVSEAFERAVRALVGVGDSFVVVSRENGRPDAAEFERQVAAPLRALVERGQSLGEIRDDLPASWLMESLIGIVVSGLQTRPSLGVEDTVAGITSLFLDGARMKQTGPETSG